MDEPLYGPMISTDVLNAIIFYNTDLCVVYMCLEQ